MLSRVPRLIRRQPLPTSLLFLPSSRFTHSSSMTPAFHLTLTPEEERLTTLLVECAEWIDENPHEVDALRVQDSKGSWVGKLMGKEKVQLRVAGGWVRDKLLGVESDDIDVSTSPDPLTGLKFATLFEHFLELQGKRDLMGRLTKLEAKPEQSKHLETATAMVGSISVDWVQQRGGEIYDDNSRIPTGVTFGTPTEDADRRDLTINALFYNPHTRLIEDPTKRGLSDLGLLPGSQPRIRTPLDPFNTFRDDPLRVVRAVRFAARFGRTFELDEGIVEAVGREEIRNALRDGKKISRERVGVELEKMLLGKDPPLALELIERLHLHPLVFLYDPSTTFLPSSPSTPAHPASTTSSITAANIISSLLSPSTPSPLHPLLQLQLPPSTSSSPPSPPSRSEITPTMLKNLYLSASLLPLYPYLTLEKKKSTWIGEKIVREGIKGSTAENKWVTKAREATAVLAEGVRSLSDRVSMGLLLRDVRVHDPMGSRWNASLFWSLVVELVEVHQDEEKSRAVIARYNSFVAKIVSYNLDKDAFLPPLLDGTAINALIPRSKNSAAMTSILSMVVHFQLEHPSASEDDARSYLLSSECADTIEGLLSEWEGRKKGKK